MRSVNCLTNTPLNRVFSFMEHRGGRAGGCTRNPEENLKNRKKVVDLLAFFGYNTIA